MPENLKVLGNRRLRAEYYPLTQRQRVSKCTVAEAALTTRSVISVVYDQQGRTHALMKPDLISVQIIWSQGYGSVNIFNGSTTPPSIDSVYFPAHIIRPEFA